MKLRKSEVPELGIDMTPMIDCVFLLLIFFMCASTMSRVDFTPEVRLPVAPRGAVPEDLRGRGTVNILPTGTAVGEGGTVTERQPFLIYGELVDDAGLKQAVSAQLVRDPALRLYLRVDRNADFALVRRAIKACAEVGVFDVIFGTFQSASGEK